MAKGKDKQKSSEKKKPLKTLLEKRKDKKDKKDKAFWWVMGRFGEAMP